MPLTSFINKASNAVAAKVKSFKEASEGINKDLPERRVVTFNLYGCILNFHLIPHFICQIGREHNLNPVQVEATFNNYLDRVRFCGDFVSYRDVLLQVMEYMDMEFNISSFRSNADELYLLHNDLKPHPEVLNALKGLKEDGFELYLLANCNMQLMQRQFEPLLNLFGEEQVLHSDECRCYMPNLEFFRKAAEKFNLRTALHFHCGANYFEDIVPASKLRWNSIYVNRYKTGVMKNYEPSVIVPNMSELYDAMVYALQRMEAEEKAAQEREAKAANDAEAQARAEEVAREAARQAQMVQASRNAKQEEATRAVQNRIHNQGIMAGIEDDMADFGGDIGGYTPMNARDREILTKMQSMAPAKARALAKARERAIANARLRASSRMPL